MQLAAGMIVVEQWTGARASLLQAAFRHTNESFARSLGIASRTVAAWHDKPALVPRTEVQQILDTALERAPDAVRERFKRLLESAGLAGEAQALTVAVAVVRRGGDVLLVCRRSENGSPLAWQFPAGVVKPGGDPAAVAVRETLAETGVHVAVDRKLGSRVHPVTGVLCEYVLCDYLTGDARNADAVENQAVAWAPVASLARFIPLGDIYVPVLEALKEPGGRDD